MPKVRRRIPRIGWWIAGTLLLLGGWWVWRSRNTGIDVQSAVITAGPLRVTVNEAGTTRIRRHSDVNAPTAGRWVPGALHNGDSVSAGQPLGSLYAAPLDATAQEQARARLGSAEASLREAEARIAAARSGAEDAERAFKRIEQVANAGGISPQDLERARTLAAERKSEFNAATLRVQGARFEVAAARSVVTLQNGHGNAISIVAPVGGQLLHVYEEHQRVVGAGTPLAEVGDPGDLEVVLPLLTADAMRVKLGAEVRMSAANGNDSLVGRVTRIEPSAFTKISALGVDEQRVNVIVTVPAQSVHLGDRYRVEARVTVWEAPQVLRVPTAALVRDGDAWSVFVVKEGRVAQRTARIGERSDDFAEVQAGLSAGERVVLYPGDRVAEGTRVRVP